MDFKENVESLKVLVNIQTCFVSNKFINSNPYPFGKNCYTRSSILINIELPKLTRDNLLNTNLKKCDY